jgi:hypothetical protein
VGVWSKLKGKLGGSKAEAPPEVFSRFVWSRNVQLRVAAPHGAGWELAEADEGGALAAAFRCLHGDGESALVLHAKLFAVAPGQQDSAEGLRAQDWKERWLASTFAEIDGLSVAIVGHMLHGFREDACEVEVEGRGREPAARLRIRERQVPYKGKLLVLTAAGPPAEHEAQARAIEAWIANSTCAA